MTFGVFDFGGFGGGHGWRWGEPKYIKVWLEQAVIFNVNGQRLFAGGH